MTGWLEDAGAVLLAVRLLAATGILISTAELLANRHDHRDDRLYSWKVFRSQPLLVRHPRLGMVLDVILRYPRYVAVLWLRLVAIVLVVCAAWWAWLDVWALGAVLLTTLLVNFRSPFGQDGSDQMSSLVFVTLFLVALSGNDEAVQWAAIWFLALQACLAYFAAGVAKARGAKWTTRGDAVYQIFNTSSYGLKSVARFLRDRPALGRLVTWSVVAAELAFPLVLVAGRPLMWLFLAWGLAFHVTNAAVMGLNSFFWAFVSTYPAILFCATALNRWMAG